MKRILISLSVFPIMALTAWVGGYNFDSRNFWAAYTLLLSVFISGFVYAFPGWKK